MYSGYVKGHFLVCLYFWIFVFETMAVSFEVLFLINTPLSTLPRGHFFAEIPHFFFSYKMYKYYVNIWTLYMDSYI